MTETKTSAPRRIFRCPRCDHQLRYGAPRCGDCYTETPIYNRKWFWRGALPGAVLAALTVAGMLFVT